MEKQKKQVKLKILMNCCAAVALTAAASYGCTITPPVPATQIARTVEPGVPLTLPCYIRVSVSSGGTLHFVGLFNDYPVTASFGTPSTDPGTVGITLRDSGAPCPSSRSTRAVPRYSGHPTPQANFHHHHGCLFLRFAVRRRVCWNPHDNNLTIEASNRPFKAQK
jgi:hypothetical protein